MAGIEAVEFRRDGYAHASSDILIVSSFYTAGASVTGIGMESFSRYYSALKAIELRFPVSPDSSHVNISFKWHDAFKDSLSCTQKNIHFEQAAIVFCMAAISSQRGVSANRTATQGIAEAAKGFAMSAGALLCQSLLHVSIESVYTMMAGAQLTPAIAATSGTHVPVMRASFGLLVESSPVVDCNLVGSS